MGAQLLETWGIPEVYAEIVRDHHVDELDEGRPLLSVVRLADQACARLGLSLVGDPGIELATLPEVHALGISETLLAELEIKLEDAMNLA